MFNHDTSFELPDYERGGRCGLWVFTIVSASFVAASGCGPGQRALLLQASVEIIRGKDSAGATIELEKHGANLTAARVTDAVLGTGEGEIISTTDGSVEFTIEFPAGATITYVGTVQDRRTSSARALAGTWTQHAEGIFGEDTGTWEAAADPVHRVDR